MIQRIQSVYLLLTTLLPILFLKGSFLNFMDKSGSVIKVTFSGLVRTIGNQDFELIEKLLPFSVLILLISLFSFATIFIFRNRKIQLILALTVTFLATGLILLSVYYFFIITARYNTELIPGFKMFIPVIIMIFAVLAYRALKKDDHLIKSYDRLR